MILAVDDEPHIRHLLRYMLSRAGYEVEVVENGLEALEILKSRPQSIEMLILDLMMNGMDGFGVLRSLGTEHQLKVLVLTASGDEQYEQQVKDLGASAFLTKPFASHELLALVEQQLGSSI